MWHGIAPVPLPGTVGSAPPVLLPSTSDTSFRERFAICYRLLQAVKCDPLHHDGALKCFLARTCWYWSVEAPIAVLARQAAIPRSQSHVRSRTKLRDILAFTDIRCSPSHSVIFNRPITYTYTFTYSGTNRTPAPPADTSTHLHIIGVPLLSRSSSSELPRHHCYTATNAYFWPSEFPARHSLWKPPSHETRHWDPPGPLLRPT